MLNIFVAYSLNRHIFYMFFNDSISIYIKCICSSLNRHILMTASPYFDSSLWDKTCSCLQLLSQVCLSSLHKLIDGFDNKTINFYDDLDKIKIITKRDCNA